MHTLLTMCTGGKNRKTQERTAGIGGKQQIWFVNLFIARYIHMTSSIFLSRLCLCGLLCDLSQSFIFTANVIYVQEEIREQHNKELQSLEINSKKGLYKIFAVMQVCVLKIH